MGNVMPLIPQNRKSAAGVVDCYLIHLRHIGIGERSANGGGSMADVSIALWLGIAGLGALWLGAQIALVAGLPRALRRGAVPSAEPGSPQAFMLFWLDQYSVIGLTLTIAGIALAGWGFTR